MSRNERGISTIAVVLVIFLVLAALVTVVVLERRSPSSRPTAVSDVKPRAAMNPEQAAYLSSLGFGDFHISAADNFLGNTVIYLDGEITNTGDKPVRVVDAELNFVDTLGQVVLRETVHPLRARAQPLQPRETRAFQVTFEHLPVDWNQVPPKVKAVYVEF